MTTIDLMTQMSSALEDIGPVADSNDPAVLNTNGLGHRLPVIHGNDRPAVIDRVDVLC